jgi:carbonic anhydrase
VPSRPDGDHLHTDIAVDPGTMLPTDRGYFRYPGSLTSAPCTEGVDWIVMKKPLHISAAQLATYKQKFADNARAVQSVNRRSILESQ